MSASNQARDRLLLVAYDFSAASDVAVDLAFAELIARRQGGSMVLLHVLPPMHPPIAVETELLRAGIVEIERATMVEVTRRLELIAERLRKRHRKAGPVAPFEVEAVVVYGIPAGVIVEVAEARGADRVYVGAHDQGSMSRFLLGSVAMRVLRTSPVPVLVAHARERAPEVA